MQQRHKRSRRHSEEGFTLIELLVVIVILASDHPAGDPLRPG